jgi:guanylate kinase
MQGILFIVSAPSGAGKSSLVNAVLESDDRLQLSISHTTRTPRPGEQNGREYFFVDRETFLRMRSGGEFLESAEVYGNLYGTSRGQLTQALEASRDVLLEIDWQGAAQVRRLFPDTVSIFILPPSLQELERRLRARAKDSPAVIERRIAAAQSEIRHAVDFDYAIINKEFEHAREDLAAVIRAARVATGRQRQRHPDLF